MINSEMIYDQEEYKNFLFLLQQNHNRPTHIPEPIDNVMLYEIDLNTREILAPPFLSVEYDHHAETIYFIVDRYYDRVDLSTLYCVVQYENNDPDPKKRGYLYAVPYLDTQSQQGKIVFPWVIQGPVTAYAGDVKFSVKFYRMRETLIDIEGGTTKCFKEYDYVLNTKPAVSKVLHGLDIHLNSENYVYPEGTVEGIYARIAEIDQRNDLYWIILFR